MDPVSWVMGAACARLGPAVGTMVCGTVEGVLFLDKQFSEYDRRALETARSRNGGCEHILLAFSSGTFSEGSPGEANDGDRQKTLRVGKRFKYSDITHLFWHPSIKFLPAGQPSEVYIGSDEKVPRQDSGPSISAAPPIKGKATCPFCAPKTEAAMKELERYLQWDKARPR